MGIPYREMSVDPDLVASFVLAVIIFENRQLRTFVKEGYRVIIEEGEYIVGLLIVDKIDEERPYRAALRRIIDTFEDRYRPQLQNWSGDIRPFREFALFIFSVFPYRDMDLNLVPIALDRSEATPDHRTKIPWAVGESDKKIELVKEFINGKRTIADIVEASGLDEAEVIAIVSMLEQYHWITLTRPVLDDSRLVKQMEVPTLLTGVYGDAILKLVDLCDGTRTLAEISRELEVGIDVVKTLARNLINAGVLRFSDGQGADRE